MALRNIFLVIFGAALFLPGTASAQSTRKVTAKFTWEIGNTQHTKSLRINSLLPMDIPGRQRVDAISVSVTPDEDYIDRSGSRHVSFKFTAPDIPDKVTIEVDILLFRSGLSVQKRQKPTPLANKEKYLGSGNYIMPNHPRIQALAARLRGRSEEETIQNIMTYLSQTIEYWADRNYSRQGNIVTLTTKKGVCGDYSDLMIALCRANGIPARASSGYMFDSDFLPGWDGDESHAWVEAYLQNYGWTPFEPTRHSMKGWKTMEPRYIYAAQDIDNSVLGFTSSYNWTGWQPRIDRFFSVK